jgi:2,4-dienoyl-CoA reductase-like NADH-dependent reductase (Old Yellow Enzyme family)
MLFSPWSLKNISARNRLVRSATYEGMADETGRPLPMLDELYATLAAHEVGTIVTGFCYISRQGRAMHPRQCGIDAEDKITPWENVVSKVRRVSTQTILLMQIAHAGRQTLPEVTNLPAIAPSDKRSPYFKTKSQVMNEADIRRVIEQFAAAALRAQKAGFDGIQLHAAHGYLIHQFLSPFMNNRTDKWGQDRFAFLREIVLAIKNACGDSFPIFAKLSVPDGHVGGIDIPLAIQYVNEMETLGVEAIEISYGTMDVPLNIFRGGAPIERVLQYNRMFNRNPAWAKYLLKRFIWPREKRKFLPFEENYNLPSAIAIKQSTKMPLVVVGGIRRQAEMERILESGQADAIALCRPFICEPDFAGKLKSSQVSRSSCTNCNICAVMCDSGETLRCYQKEVNHA